MLNTNECLVFDREINSWVLYKEPLHVFVTHESGNVLKTLKQVEKCVHEENLSAVGFLSYESSCGINPELTTHKENDFPLCWFGLFQEGQAVKPEIKQSKESSISWQNSITRAQYDDAIFKLKKYISDGDTYQVNFTYPLHTKIDTFKESIFWNMISAQGDNYGAYIELPDWAICSASPELFFSLNNNELICKPMKGTAPRHTSHETDLLIANTLKDSSKDRAENLMIVDMVRNDLG